MSAVPPAFTPQTSFSTLAQQPITTTGLPGSQLDGEFSRAADSINQIKDRLSEIQRDDGKLRNGVVNTESLSADVRNLFVASGTKPVTWAVGAQFAVGDFVSNPPGTPGTYLCIVAHTSSSVFANDLANWALIAAPPAAGVLHTNTFIGDGATTNFTLTDEPTTIDSTQVFIDGIYQPKSGYSVDGTALTITPAPSTGSDIEVVIGVPSTFNLATVTDGAISTAKLASNSVTEPKIAALSITEAKLVNNSVSLAKIADSAVSTAKLIDGAVTNSKLAISSVTADKVANEAITSAKLAPLSVSSDKISNNAVTALKIAGNSVTTEKISDLSIIAAKIANGAVETSKLADGVVSSDKIGSSAVIPSKIASAAVTTEKIDNAAVTASKLSGAQSGSAPIYAARAWVSFDATITANIVGSAKRDSGSFIVTITLTNHGLLTGHKVFINFASTIVDGSYVVTKVDNDTFQVVTLASTPASGVAATVSKLFIRSSGNVSCVSRLSNGNFVVNFTTFMQSSNDYTGVFNSIRYAYFDRSQSNFGYAHLQADDDAGSGANYSTNNAIFFE